MLFSAFTSGPTDQKPLPESAVKLSKSSNHMGNFFESMRSRKDPICDVEIGHRSITVAHLGVISVRMKQPLKWDPAPGTILRRQREGSEPVARA